MARDYLGLLAASASTELVFSGAADICTFQLSGWSASRGAPPPRGDIERYALGLSIRIAFFPPPTSTPKMLCTLLLAALAATSASAQIPSTATPSALLLVDAQYINSGFASTTNTGFGVPLKSAALLSVEYPFGLVGNGAPYTADQVATLPALLVTPSNSTAGQFTSSSKYTIMLADASSLGDPDPQGNFRHYLANDVTGAAPASGANVTFTPDAGTVITSYAAPGPIAGSGPHRYAWLFFTQPATFEAPSGLNASGTTVSSYVAETGLSLVAASFFTVENGTPTGSVVATSAVNTASLGSASGGSGSSTSSSAPSASSTRPASSGASRLAGSAFGILGAIVGVVILL